MKATSALFALTIVGATLLAVHAANASPGNDDFAGATDLGNPTSTNAAGSTEEGSVEPDEPGAGTGDLGFWNATSWWSWTSPIAGLVYVDTQGSDFDTVLSVFTGSELITLQPVGISHDAEPDGTSRVAFHATAGTRYFFRVHAEGDMAWQGGQVNLSLRTQTMPATADDYVAWGKARLRFLTSGGADENSLEEALQFFEHALVKTHGEALLYRALIYLVQLQKEEAFDDLLANLGVEDLNEDSNNPDYSIPEDDEGNLKFADGADTAQVKEYIETVARPQLEKILNLLGQIRSSTFAGTLPDWIGFGDEAGQTKLVDQADVTLLRAGCSFVLSGIEMMRSLELAASLEEIADMHQNDTLSVEQVLGTFDNLLEFATSDRRSQSLALMRSALDLYDKGSALMHARKPAAQDFRHLFSLSDMEDGEEEEFRDMLKKIRLSLSGKAQDLDGWMMNLSRLYATKHSFRSLLPNFKSDKVIKGSVPNVTFDGLLPRATKIWFEEELRKEDLLYEGSLSLEVQVAQGHDARGTANGSTTSALAEDPVIATAIPEAPLGYLFGRWSLDNSVVSVANPYQFPLIRDTVLVAHFVEDARDPDRDGLDTFHEMQIGTDPNNPDSDGDGIADGLDSDPLTADPIRITVSETVDWELKLQTGTILSISGLPNGLKFSHVTRRLTGKATAIKGTTQVFSPIAVVRSAAGETFKLPLRITVDALDSHHVGTFSGLVSANDDEDLGSGLGGQVDLTVSTSGACSGRISLPGRSFSFKGALDTSTQEPLLAELHVQVPNGKTKSLRLDLALGTDDRFAGTLQDETGTTTHVGGWRNVWSSKAPLGSPQLGYFTSRLEPDELTGGIGDPGVPQGIGRMTLTTKSVGTVTWQSKLADGVAVTRSSILGPDGEAGFWAPLYSNRGSLLGEGAIAIDDGTVSGDVIWKKPDDIKPGRLYPSAFEAELHPVGGPYSTDILGAAVLAKFGGDSPNAVIAFAGANLDPDNAPNVGATLVKGTKAVTFTVVKTPNPAGVRCSLNMSTGVFTGSFTLKDPDPVTGKTLTRTSSFEGVVTPRDENVFGTGYFLLAQMPDPDAEPPTTSKTSRILSGVVSLAPPAP